MRQEYIRQEYMRRRTKLRRRLMRQGTELRCIPYAGTIWLYFQHAVQEKTGSESSNCPELDDEPPLRQIIPRKRSRSMSADIETDNEDEFAAELYIRLHVEARYQKSLEDTTVQYIDPTQLSMNLPTNWLRKRRLSARDQWDDFQRLTPWRNMTFSKIGSCTSRYWLTDNCTSDAGMDVSHRWPKNNGPNDAKKRTSDRCVSVVQVRTPKTSGWGREKQKGRISQFLRFTRKFFCFFP